MIFFVACLGSILGILVIDHRSQASLHLSSQRGFLAFRYLPSIIGTFTTMWWRSIGTAFFHIMPYMSIADSKVQASPSNDQRRKNWPRLVVIYLQVMLVFIVPIKSVFIQLLPDESGWIVSVSRVAAGFLIAMYSLLITCTIFMALWFRNRQTGLKWDPVCIADQIALIQGSNILKSFHGLEFATREEVPYAFPRNGLLGDTLRLGYWKIGDTGEIWHGIAFPTG